QPMGSFISDGTYLYGTTESGGANNFGTIFKIKTDGSGYLKLFEFPSYIYGSSPDGALLYDGTYLYGVADDSGAHLNGTIFKIKPDGTGFTNLYAFLAQPDGDT